MTDRYRWVGTHAYRDHRNDRVIETGEEIGDDAERIADAHPHDVERIDEEDGAESESDDTEAEDEICGYEKDDGSICQRDAGWGRDADSGRCKDHADE